MAGPRLVDVLPDPDPETVRKLLALLAPASDDQHARSA